MNIKPSTVTPESIFTGISTRYRVPHYQRDYAWTGDNFEALWNDVCSAFAQGNSYFLGSIVLNGEGQRGDDNKRWDIVDGQQRLATLTILFATIRDLASTYVGNPLDPVFQMLNGQQASNKEKAERIKIIASNLVVRIGSPDNYYLELNEKDQGAFYEIQCSSLALLRPDQWSRKDKSEKRVKKAKKFFAQHVYEMVVKATDGFNHLERFLTFCMTQLLLLRIEVETDSDAYLLFESLNDRGLDLSIADLVKNRLLLASGSDTDRKRRVLAKWDAMIELLKDSRYEAQEFLRFYWIAFHQPVTKNELYLTIKSHLASCNPEDLVDSLVESCTYFSQITKQSLRYPVGVNVPEAIEQKYAEINTLGYSVCYPLFLWCNKHREELLLELVPFSLSYLFRLITIAGFAANKAEGAFTGAKSNGNGALSLLKRNSQATLAEVLNEFKDEELQDQRFVQRLKTNLFEDNKTARYILSRIHDKFNGSPALRLTKEAQLEHVLPVSRNSWPDFDLKGRERADWVYSLGNMTLLESSLNQSGKDSAFQKKVLLYREHTGRATDEVASAIPMTQRIYNQATRESKVWNADWILSRANEFAANALDIWKIPANLQLSTGGAPLSTDSAGSV